VDILDDMWVSKLPAKVFVNYSFKMTVKMQNNQKKIAGRGIKHAKYRQHMQYKVQFCQVQYIPY